MKLSAFLLFVWFTLGTARAAEIPAAKSGKTPQAREAANKEEVLPVVIKASNLSSKALGDIRRVVDAEGKLDSKLLSDEAVKLHDKIVVQIANLRTFAEKKPEILANAVLYLDGKAIPDIKPETDLWRNDLLFFGIKRTNKSRDEWKALLGRPGNPDWLTREVRLSVGIEGQQPFPSKATITLHVLGAIWLWTLVISLVLVVVLFWAVEPVRRIVRDNDTNKARGPFSLARVQMAWWFFWVVLAYGFIYAVTGYFDALSQSVLALIGISGGTGVVAAAVDDSTRKKIREQLAAAEKDIAALTAKKAANQQLTADESQKLLELENDKRKDDAVAYPQSNGFFKDIFSFAGSDSAFHRLQMIVWTLMLTVIFLREVYNGLSMPEFSGELLGLMGISSGTYLGFKAVSQK